MSIGSPNRIGPFVHSSERSFSRTSAMRERGRTLPVLIPPAGRFSSRSNVRPLNSARRKSTRRSCTFELVKKYTGSKGKRTSVFLIGNAISGEARELADMRAYPTLQTYQDMVENARRRYQEYLRIVEAEGEALDIEVELLEENRGG